MKKTSNIFIQSVNGLAYGYFITYGLGTILMMIAQYTHIELLSTIGSILQSLMGIGIAISIAIHLKIQGLNMLCMVLSGGIASYFSSYVFMIYLAILLSAEIMQFLDTSFDLWLKPLLTMIISLFIAYVLNPYINTMMNDLGYYFNQQMNSQSLLVRVIMSVVIAIVMGLFASSIGGVTICSLMNLNSLCCGIVLSGICSYTIGIMIMIFKDNHISDTLACFIGTPMLALTNIIRHPVSFIPLIVSSAISGILSGCVFLIAAPDSAGYGFMAFKGIIDTIAYNHSVYMSAILLINIGVPIVVCFGLKTLLYRLKLIRHGDLKIEHL